MQKNTVKNAVVVGALVVGGMAPVIMSYSDDIGADEKAKQEMKIQGVDLDAENTEETGTSTKVEVDGELVEETESEPEKEATESEQAESTESEPEEEKTEGEQVESTESEQKEETDSEPEKEEEGEQTEEDTEEETDDLAEAKRLHKEVAEKLSGKDKADFTEEESQLYNDYIFARAKLYPVNETEGNVEDIVTLPYQDEQVVPEDELPLTEFGDLDFVKYHEIAQGRALPRPLSAVESDLYNEIMFNIYPRSYYSVGGILADYTLVWELKTLEERNDMVSDAENFEDFDVKKLENKFSIIPGEEMTFESGVTVDKTSVYTVDEFNQLPDKKVAEILAYNGVISLNVRKGEVYRGVMQVGDTYEKYEIKYISEEEDIIGLFTNLETTIDGKVIPTEEDNYRIIEIYAPNQKEKTYQYSYCKTDTENNIIYDGEFLFNVAPEGVPLKLNIELPESHLYSKLTGREPREYIIDTEEVYIPGKDTEESNTSTNNVEKDVVYENKDFNEEKEVVNTESETSKQDKSPKENTKGKYQKTGISSPIITFISVLLGSVFSLLGVKGYLDNSKEVQNGK